MSDPNLLAAQMTHTLVNEALAAPARKPVYDAPTVDAAVNVIRDRITRTSWASEAKMLNRLIAEIEKELRS